MPESALSVRKVSNLRNFLIPVFVALFADQLSKILVVHYLSPFDPPFEVIGSLLRFKVAYNPYGVFSLSFGPKFLYYFLHIAGIVLFTYLGVRQNTKFRTVLFGLIVGGALGNVFDRVRLHYVIDFIDMGVGNIRWFTYNLADAFVTVSAVLLIANELIKSQTNNQ